MKYNIPSVIKPLSNYLLKIYKSFKLYFIPLFLLLLTLPIFFLLLYFKNEYSNASSLLESLQKVHLSHEKLSLSAKKSPLSLHSLLHSITPLSNDKSVLYSLKSLLPENIESDITTFFDRNKLQLRRIEQKDCVATTILKLDNPVIIRPSELTELINLIDNHDLLSYNTFNITKKNPDQNLLILDFSIISHEKKI